MTTADHHHPLERCLNWIESHPTAMLWLLVMSTANFFLAVLEALGLT